MRHIIKYILVAIVAFLAISSCVYKFEAEGSEGGGVLVIEGDIIIGGQSDFTISKSLPRNSDELVQSVIAHSVVIECEDGSKYEGVYNEVIDPEFVQGIKGCYTVNTLDLNPDKKYRLVVNMPTLDGKNNGRTYCTDFLDVYQTPPIDSVNFSIDANKVVYIMVNTHSDDPFVKNYKWSYLEDWEIHSHQYADYLYDSDSNKVSIMTHFSEQNTYYCWRRNYSSKIIVGSSENLSENIISGQRVTHISHFDDRVSALYAIEVYQKAISDASYKYWLNVFKNNEEIGGIFSPQPNEMRGNLYCVEDPAENILGYIDACTITKKRMWFDALSYGIYDRGKHTCEIVTENNPDFWHELYRKGFRVTTYDFMSGNYSWAPIGCVDCRLYGTKNRPDYFPAR